MRKTLLLVFVCAFTASLAGAVPFSPTLLKLSAPSGIQYDFDGKELKIPVTVSGTPASVSLFIYTKDKASQIKKIRNGYLGWHYVNNIDTCVYMSKPAQLDKGTASVSWDGKNKDGALVSAGDYTYYLWGYDNISARTRVSYNWYPYVDTDLLQFDGKGQPRANPIIYKYTSRWVIGTDPADSLTIETCKMSLPSGWRQFRSQCFQPGDLSMFYMQADNSTSKTQGLWKFQWVPNGTAVLQTGWADQGKVTYNQPHYQGTGVTTDFDYLYAGYYGQNLDGDTNNLRKFDFDGNVVKTWSLTEWMYHAEDWAQATKAQSAGGPSYMPCRNGKLFFNHFGSCIKAMVNPNAENDDDLFEWVNQNGDYVVDHNFDATAKFPWVCFDFNTAPYNYTFSPDANLFSITPCYDLGAVSFALLGPDGIGVGYFAFSGEMANWKYGQLMVDNGSAFDGIYCDNMCAADNASPASKKFFTGVWYVGHDSIKGTIGTQIGVKDAAPAAFTVAQNTPNPFNPATTISFTLAKAGKTTVEVFNAAGQKVDTILNANLNAGSHSTTWNAAKFSAGVYFYTVR
ncbi:MAG: T9SS type A sorting domain-containing protein, partial [Candidatus Latescibacterota bacterium]